MRGKATVSGIAGKLGFVTEVLGLLTAIWACSTCVAKPGDTDTASKPRGLDTVSNGIDNADNLVTGNKR
jgi:hypothetical protein